MDDTRKVLKKFKRPIGVFLGLGIVVSFLSALMVQKKRILSLISKFSYYYSCEVNSINLVFNSFSI